MRRAAFTVGVFGVGLSWQLGAQQPPVKSITTGVIMDVTAVGAQGNPVLDLTLDDFELSEDGVRQRIVSATLVQRGAVRPLRSATPGTGQPSANAESGAAPTAARSETSVTPSVTAILFDRLSPESRALARRAALAYVSTLTPPHDYVGVFLADLSLRTFQPFTNEHETLAKAIDQVASTAPPNTRLEPGSSRIQGLTPDTPPTAGAESKGGGFSNITEREHRLTEIQKLGGMDEALFLQMELRMREEYQQFLAEVEGQSSIAGLRAVVSSIGRVSGRKSIFFFAENVPITARLKAQFESLIGEANRANITVYTVDAAGLRVHSKDAELARNVAVAGAKGIGDEQRDTKTAWTKDLEEQEQMLSSRPTAVLGRLAKETGGFLIENTNDLGAGVARMQQERTTYYLLAYQPTNATLDGKFRKVSVKVKRSKVTVRARPGYLAPREYPEAGSDR
jgi:VWFA-related protein